VRNRILNRGGHLGSGTAARYFHQFRYEGKASPRDRSELCRDLLWKRDKDSPIGWVQIDQAEYDQLPESDRAQGNIHATVKNTKLMDFLITLTTPPGGVVLDPFMGSGSTGVAAIRKGFGFIGIEREPGYMAIAQARIKAAQPQQQPTQKPDLEQRVEWLETQVQAIRSRRQKPRGKSTDQLSLFG
jgi:hypothetical protein